MRFEVHSHTMYSNIRILDALCRPKELIQKAADLGYAGIAITDHEALCGHIDWLQAEEKLKADGKIPQDFVCALGNEIYLVDNRDGATSFPHFILIAKNTEGHRALRELSSGAWYHAFSYRGMERVPTTKKELSAIVKKYPGSLIASSSCLGSELARLTCDLIDKEKQNEDVTPIKIKIRDFLVYCLDLFGDDFYVEIAPSAAKRQVLYNERVVQIADAFGIKVVQGTDGHYYSAAEREWHKALLTSKPGEREVDEFYYYAHLMDDEEAKSNLSETLRPRFEEFCDNSLELMRKIGKYDLFHKSIIPHVDVPIYRKGTYPLTEYPILNELVNSDNVQKRYWINQCLDALKEKGLWNDTYLARLSEEADILNVVSEKLENCMYEYFNTFQHFIDLFWECGSVTGPGRGSSSCFLSNYLLGIVQVDAIEWDLPVFRFLNKERVELPDIDVDLAAAKRPKIFEAIRKERGELNLIQVATFGTESSRSACKTACRGYRSDEYPSGIDPDTATYLTSLIPSQRGFTWPIKDVIYGNKEEGRAPVTEFAREMEKYPGLLDIILAIEGIVSRRGQHASGVMLYNNSPFETNAIMRSPNGDLTTQFDLHQSELLGDTKFDFLITQTCDKIGQCIELLQNGGYFDKNKSLRQIYNETLHPDILDLNIEKLWDAIDNNEIIDLFQFDSMVGAQGIAQVQPRSVMELLMTNALIRLAGEKGHERPMDRYVRMKNNIDLWYLEMRQWGLTEEQIHVLEPHYKPYYGTPTTQESLMKVCLDPKIAGFSLADANHARKIVSKKRVKEIPELKEKFVSACETRQFGEYVWETCMLPQMSYAFALPHAVVYSLIGYQIAYLATMYPRVYWNCACLIINAGGEENLDTGDDDEFEDDKKKDKAIDYGRIATAIGKMRDAGIEVAPPSINKSSFTFSPDEASNKILYGINGITKIKKDFASVIMRARPFTSVEDFVERMGANKLQTVNLIKSGAFDEFGDRRKLMEEWAETVAETKKTLNLRNLPMLVREELLPDELDEQIRFFNYTNYLKKLKKGDFYSLDEVAFNAFERYAPVDLLRANDESESGFKVSVKDWEKLWKKVQDVFRNYITANQKELLTKVNTRAINEITQKYATGSISKWEMDSVSYYSHPHELAAVDHKRYGFADYSKLPDDPVVERVVKIKGKDVPLFRIERIAGTVLSRDKIKKTVTLLTTSGVVVVKIFGDVFAHYDRQLSEIQPDGIKVVLEKSWFARGNKIIICGVKKDNCFLAKKYSRTPWHLVELITDIDENGNLTVQSERMEVN